MRQMSRALTYSDTKEVYVNIPNIIDLSTYEKFERRLTETKKDTFQINEKCLECRYKKINVLKTVKLYELS